LGYAHALRKPTILLADRDKQLPFDISGYRCLFYENTIGGKAKVEEGLRKHLTQSLVKLELDARRNFPEARLCTQNIYDTDGMLIVHE
jgi:hypothetical protein